MSSSTSSEPVRRNPTWGSTQAELDATPIRPASEVSTMNEVRAAIDDLDRKIVGLLGDRMRYIEAAARIKPTRDTVRDQWRIDDVYEKAAAKAREVNFPEHLVRAMYRELVEGSIAHEFVNWDANREGSEEKKE